MSTVKPSSQRTLSKVREEDRPLAPIPEAQLMGGLREHRDLLRYCFIPADESGCLGLHLSRTPWDPYPWVSGVVEGSRAEVAGVRIGDCVLEANGEDLLGLKVIDIAKRVRSRRISRTTPAGVGLLLWNSGFDKNNLNPQSLSRFANCLQGIAGLLECPICLEIIRPPSWQCAHGHLICSGCRSRTTKCPICREVLGRGRCIVADKLFHYLVQTLGHEGDQSQYTPLDPKSQHPTRPRQGNVPGRRLPLMLRECPRRPTQHPHDGPKYASKLKANIAPNGTTAPRLDPVPSTVTLHCPSGQPCGRMKNQHDILIHLQKAHQTSVVQYYVMPGDAVDVALVDAGCSTVACVALLSPPVAPKSHEDRNDVNHRHQQLFFVTKFRCLEESNECLHWLWHVGDESRCDRFQVQLLPIVPDDRQSSPSSSGTWQGRPVPLTWSCQEVLRSKRFARMNQDVRKVRVRVLIVKGNDPEDH